MCACSTKKKRRSINERNQSQMTVCDSECRALCVFFTSRNPPPHPLAEIVEVVFIPHAFTSAILWLYSGSVEQPPLPSPLSTGFVAPSDQTKDKDKNAHLCAACRSHAGLLLPPSCHRLYGSLSLVIRISACWDVCPQRRDA